MESTSSRGKGKVHRFGGDWTTAKLNVIAQYLNSYTSALKEKPSPEHPFHKAFIDAFAGTGYRQARRDDRSIDDPSRLLFPDLASAEPQSLLDGSARLALQTNPRFDKYIFVEKDVDRCGHLEELKIEFPDLAADIEIRQGNANAEIQKICQKDWRSHRAVLFLDPYGLSVEWKTVKAIAETRAIDLWLLFPLGIGVNRLLTRSGDIPESWRSRLTALLGSEEWYEAFYRTDSVPTLFEAGQKRVTKASMEAMGGYFNDRLKGIFAGVADPPGVLRNSTNNPLYLLCFAVGNRAGAPIALRIARHLLKELR
jgi:three-Cys-motif partner protein